MEEEGDVSEEANREAGLLEQVSLLGPQSPRKNVQHLGFVFFAVLALPSGGNIDTCDIYREKRSCRCYVLPELYQTVSVPPRFFDAKDATTQSWDLKHTKCHHLDPTRSITKWESMSSTSLTQSARASRSCMLYVWKPHTIKHGLREPETLCSPSFHACLRGFEHGWTRWAGWLGIVRCD